MRLPVKVISDPSLTQMAKLAGKWWILIAFLSLLVVCPTVWLILSAWTTQTMVCVRDDAECARTRHAVWGDSTETFSLHHMTLSLESVDDNLSGDRGHTLMLQGAAEDFALLYVIGRGEDDLEYVRLRDDVSAHLGVQAEPQPER